MICPFSNLEGRDGPVVARQLKRLGGGVMHDARVGPDHTPILGLSATRTTLKEQLRRVEGGKGRLCYKTKTTSYPMGAQACTQGSPTLTVACARFMLYL
jgi:hypothetical protein